MNRKLTGATLGLLLALTQTAGAYGLTWIDKDYDFSKIGQVGCLAIGENAPFNADANLLKESKKVKAVFLPAYGIKDSKDKAALGKLIKEKTGANAFLVTEIVMNTDQTDYVEGKYFPVTMHEYTEVSGPDGKHIERERYYDTNYHFAAHNVDLHKLEVDFHLYDAATGKRIFSFTDVRRSYDRKQDDLFKDIAKEFFVSLKDTPKLAEKTRGRNIVMDSVQVYSARNENDKGPRAMVMTESLYSELFIGGAQVKNVLLGDKTPSNYALRVKVYNYTDVPYWEEPTVTTSDKLVRSWTEKRRVKEDAPKQGTVYTVKGGDDRLGKTNGPVQVKPAATQPTYKEISIVHKEYRTNVNEHPGGYKYKGEVSMAAEVVDRRTGAVAFAYKNSKTNDKRTDAWMALVKDFYNKLSKGIKK